jgi:glycosyltransferase involved in cell wall biosynthesis
MDRANYALADFLARQGIQIELVAFRVAPELLAYENVVHHVVPKPQGSYFLGSRKLAILGKIHAERILHRGGRVIVNGGNCCASDVNWVHYVHDAYVPRTHSVLHRIKQLIERPIVLTNERRCLKQARLIIANSDLTRDTIANSFGIPLSKIRTVYYGIDEKRFQRPTATERQALRNKFGWDGAPRVVFIGALGDRRKGFDTLGAAWSNLIRDESWNARLVVIGEGAEQRKWKDEWSRSSRKELVEFLGFRKDVPDLLRAADCLVSPTRYEAYGLGIHEALCCGLPVIVSRSAGVAERIPKELKMLLLDESENVVELTSKLRQWYSNREEYSKLVVPLQILLSRKSWDDMAKELLEQLAN